MSDLERSLARKAKRLTWLLAWRRWYSRMNWYRSSAEKPGIKKETKSVDLGD